MTPDVHARVRDIRAGLPGQLRQQRLQAASLLYGPLYSLDEVHRRIALSLPFRFGALRRVRVVPIERADILLPDDMLLAYDDAFRSGVFSRFLVATPAYYWRAQPGAWLVAQVDGTTRWAILASVAALPAAA
jgi:hypothetical protein